MTAPVPNEIYLVENPPARRQFYEGRKYPVTGLIGVHTAENPADTTGDDSGAEGVARFIRGRSDPGSYHTLGDADSIIRLCRYSSTAFGAKGFNGKVLHFGFAIRHDSWADLPAGYVAALLDNGGKATAHMAQWVLDTHGITVPAERLSRPEADDGAPGFIDHSRLDPARRHDPGAGMPWDDFFERYLHHFAGAGSLRRVELVADLQSGLNERGAEPPLEVDGVYGLKTAQQVWLALRTPSEAALHRAVTEWFESTPNEGVGR